VIEPKDTMNYSHRISRRGPKHTYAYSMDSVSEKISRTSARIAVVGLILSIIKNPGLNRIYCGSRLLRLDQCDAHQLEPFKLALVKTELELCVGRRLLSRV
jgi:hypothetical protein